MSNTTSPLPAMKILFLSSLFCLLFFVVHAQNTLPAKPEDVSPLLIGEKVPGLLLANEKGEKTDLGQLFSAKPTVLIFYRGGWCPYCNKHLSEIGEAESKILALGYQIAAVSPDKVSKLAETMGKDRLNYHLFSDSAGAFSKAMGIAYQAPSHYLKTIAEASDGVNKESLPVPSLFVVNTKGEIVFEFIQPNFKTRISARLLLAVLEGLR